MHAIVSDPGRSRPSALSKGAIHGYLTYRLVNHQQHSGQIDGSSAGLLPPPRETWTLIEMTFGAYSRSECLAKLLTEGIANIRALEKNRRKRLRAHSGMMPPTCLPITSDPPCIPRSRIAPADIAGYPPPPIYLACFCIACECARSTHAVWYL